MKRFSSLLVITFLLLLGQSGPPSGGGGGGGPTTQGVGGGVTNTCGADNYCNVANFGAKADLKIIQGAGAMDNNVTANLTDTTNHQFTAGDVGKLICVDGAGAAGIETCGTISSFTSTSVVVLSFNNTSGGAISSKEYWYGTDNKTAIALAASTAVFGQTVWIPGQYASSDGFIKKASVSFAGPGGAVPWWILGNGASVQVKCGNYTGGTTCDTAYGTSIGSGIAFLTKSMTRAGISEVNATGQLPSQLTNTVACSGLTLWAGVGMHFDGGGATIDGIDLINYGHERIDKCNIEGFKRDGVRLSDAGAAGVDYSVQARIIDSFIFGNGGSGINIAGVDNLENTRIENNEIDSNQLNGIDINLGSLPGAGLLISSNILQWNNMSHTAGDGELKSEAALNNVRIADNWFEHQQTNDVLWAGVTSANPMKETTIQGNSCIGTACTTDYPPIFNAGGTQGQFIAFMNGSASLPAVDLGNFDTTAGDFLGCIQFGALGASDAERRTAYICSEAVGSTATHATGQISFATNNAGTLAEQMHLWSDGALSVADIIDKPTAIESKSGYYNNGNSAVEYALEFSGLLGGLSSTASATLLQSCDVAVNAGHFTNLVITNDLNGATCTTAPTYNIRDDTAATTGTALTASTTAGQVTQAESLAFSAGDRICLVRTINGGTCSTPIFSVRAHMKEP